MSRIPPGRPVQKTKAQPNNGKTMQRNLGSIAGRKEPKKTATTTTQPTTATTTTTQFAFEFDGPLAPGVSDSGDCALDPLVYLPFFILSSLLPFFASSFLPSFPSLLRCFWDLSGAKCGGARGLSYIPKPNAWRTTFQLRFKIAPFFDTVFLPFWVDLGSILPPKLLP